MADSNLSYFRTCLGFLLWLLQASTLSYGGQKLRMVNLVSIPKNSRHFDMLSYQEDAGFARNHVIMQNFSDFPK